MTPGERAANARRLYQSLAAAGEDPAAVMGKLFNPTQYTISIELSGQVGKSQGGKVTLRPEDFLLERITWACVGDTPVFIQSSALPGYSIQGRSVEMTWGDEFTQVMGDQPALIAAVLGDSNGFLDLPGGLFFQGGQTLGVKLTRVLWPDPEVEPANMRFDFTFHGKGILPAGMAASGSL